MAVRIKKAVLIPEDFPFETYRVFDCKRIQAALLEYGYEPTLDECHEIWREVSETYAAGWLGLPNTSSEIYTMCYSHIEPA